MRTETLYPAADTAPAEAGFSEAVDSSPARLFCGERLASGDALAGLGLATGDLALVEHEGACRARVERFIARRFAESFSARVDAFMPRLFAMCHDDGAIRGAFGLRSATRRLFLEHYLDQPIEQAVARSTGAPVERAAIVEVGHFSGAFPGAMRTMIWLLTQRLHRESFRWVVFTGTTSLRNAFRRIGLEPVDLGPADARRLPPATTQWGSYYEQGPRVFAGLIDDGVRTLAQSGAPARSQQRTASA